MNLNITATLSEEQLKTIVNDWFVRKENMEVESIDFSWIARGTLVARK